MRVAADGEAVLASAVVDLGKIRVLIVRSHSVVDKECFVTFTSDILDDLILFVITKIRMLRKKVKLPLVLRSVLTSL